MKMEKNYYADDAQFVPFESLLPARREKSGLERKAEELTSAAGKKEGPTDGEVVLREILSEKSVTLKDLLEEIGQQIKDRDALRSQTLAKIEENISALNTKVMEIETWHLGQNWNIDWRRMNLEKQVELLQQEGRGEARECWRDIAQLRKEHRQLFREYRNALKRMKIVSPTRKHG